MKQTHKCCICDDLFACTVNECRDKHNPSASICDECLDRSLARLESLFTHSRKVVYPRSQIKHSLYAVNAVLNSGEWNK